MATPAAGATQAAAATAATSLAGATDIWSLFANWRFVALLASGLVIVLLFARDRYDRASYDDNVSAPFPRLPPRLLAPDFRFQEGLRLYMIMMGSVYLLACLIGPQLLAVPQFGLSDQLKDPLLWPLGVAMALTAISVLDDRSFLGGLENRLRRFAHEYALIPTEVKALSERLKHASVAHWGGFHKPSQLDLACSLAAPIGLDPDKTFVDYRNHWQRAAILISGIKELERSNRLPTGIDPQMQEFLSQIDLKHDSLALVIKDFDAAAPEGREADQRQINHDAVSLLQMAAFFLATIVFQSAKSRANLAEILAFIGHDRLYTPKTNRRSDFIFAMLTGILGFGVVAALLILLGNLVIGILSLADGEKGNRALWTVIVCGGSLALLYGFTFLTTYWHREHEIQNRRWEENPGYRLKKVWILSTLVTLALMCLNILIVGGVTSEWIYMFGLFTWPLVAIAVWLFLKHMQQAARTWHDPGAPPEYVARHLSDESATFRPAPGSQSRLGDALTKIRLANPFARIKASVAAFCSAPTALPFLHGALACLVAGLTSFAADYLGTLNDPKFAAAQARHWVEQAVKGTASTRLDEKLASLPDGSDVFPALLIRMRLIEEQLANMFVLYGSEHYSQLKGQQIEPICVKLQNVWTKVGASGPKPIATPTLFEFSVQDPSKNGNRPATTAAGKCRRYLEKVEIEAGDAGSMEPKAPAEAAGPAGAAPQGPNPSTGQPAGINPISPKWAGADQFMAEGSAIFETLALSLATAADVAQWGLTVRSIKTKSVIFALLAGAMALGFSILARDWRVYQLSTNMETADKSRRSQFEEKFAQETAAGETQLARADWFTEPCLAIGRMTRLEALQYDEYEAEFLPTPDDAEPARPSADSPVKVVDISATVAPGRRAAEPPTYGETSDRKSPSAPALAGAV